MKNLLGSLIAILFVQISFSQDYQSEFLKYCEAKDSIKQLDVLTKWESKNPKDAELFTSYFNYHVMKSMQEVIALTTNTPNEEAMVLKDSLNKTTAYLESQLYYNPQELKKGFDKIDQGITLYPNRLDMRFGKIYVLSQALDWKNFTSEIIKTIAYSATNDNQWTWTNHEPYDGTEKEFLLDIQDYQYQLYNTGNDDLFINMREIANEVLKYYPNHVESLSNLSVTYLLTGEYDKGIAPLLKAEKLNPKDYIVLGNIAQGYKLKGDKQKAIAYYKKMVQFGDENTKAFASQQITALEE
ncbi:MAG: tetratricopeptide repeat protein [Winogradskyella arenosi]